MKRFLTSGFTLVELLVVIAVIGLLLGMFLPFAGRGVRGAARRSDCANRMRQLAIASHNYHEAHQHLPSVMGPLPDTYIEAGSSSRLSGFVSLFPYMEQHDIWDEIVKARTYEGVRFPAGPEPWSTGYEPYSQRIEALLCPSSSDNKTEFGNTNYAFSIGDVARSIHNPTTARGAFACGIKSNLTNDFPDGTSNTIALLEVEVANSRLVAGQYAINQAQNFLDNPSACLKLADSEQQKKYYVDSVQLSQHGRGSNWASGTAESTLANTILAPGSPSCAIGGSQGVDGFYSASSSHDSGVNVAFMDGSVHHIIGSINAGDPSVSAPTQAELATAGFLSPYGVWGALGGKNDGGATNDDF